MKEEGARGMKKRKALCLLFMRCSGVCLHIPGASIVGVFLHVHVWTVVTIFRVSRSKVISCLCIAVQDHGDDYASFIHGRIGSS